MNDFRGRTALITGASGGIGEEFARRLAERGSNLLLVARTEPRLRALADDLASRHGVSAGYVALDLSAEGASGELYSIVERRGLSVDILINNAGFGSLGEFAALPLERELQMLRLNVVTLADLTHRFLNRMIERKGGAIINVASTAGFQPVPYMANYAATKAYVLSLSEALWAENREHGVTVMALCPGPTETGFFDAASMRDIPPRKIMQTPGEVVEAALDGLAREKSHVVSGWASKLMVLSERLAPRRTVVGIGARIFKSRR